eukprot:CAMPEP_0119502262 /NCGR_PEP_ID=MMETSP1344-20130328/23797_1 /TAXON_ID=236787 /ORGANISM="Florenciella parvula, Strain CCMP2471" /LENGTH=42 /DNA_ID= /DNA_START= /DNA_END= /DNA_ORIENTATION=
MAHQADVGLAKEVGVEYRVEIERRAAQPVDVALEPVKVSGPA